MKRRNFCRLSLAAPAAAPVALLAGSTPAQAFGGLFGGGSGGIGSLLPILTAIRDLLDGRFAEMLETAALLPNLASVVESLNTVIDLYSQARGLYYTLDAVAHTFEGLYTAATDLDFLALRNRERELFVRFKGLARQAANLQAAVVSSGEWEIATSELLTLASKGTTSVTGQLQILNQLTGILSTQSHKVQALLVAQTQLLAEQEAERALVREQAPIIEETFWQNFRTDPEGGPRIFLPGVGG